MNGESTMNKLGNDSVMWLRSSKLSPLFSFCGLYIESAIDRDRIVAACDPTHRPLSGLVHFADATSSQMHRVIAGSKA